MSNEGVYLIDYRSDLYLIKWSDIKAGIYSTKSLVVSDIEDFYTTKSGHLSHIDMDGIFTVAGIASIDLNDAVKIARWSSVIKAGNYWLVAGDHGGPATIAVIDSTGLYKRGYNVEVDVGTFDLR